MKIVVASGKGGTGKTTVATNLALIAGKVELIDLDVEEPNDALFINPEYTREKNIDMMVPEVDQEKCTNCGICSQVCEFNAIATLGTKTMTFHELCHGCGLCAYACPEKAITEVPHPLGVIRFGRSGDTDFIEGVLNLGEPMATPLIRETKKEARGELTIMDAPPGTSCPVIESIHAADFCILVTEPTPFGLWDLKLAVGVVRDLKVPFGVIINRYGSGDEGVERYCEEEGIEVLARIPMDRRIAEAYSRGIPIVKALPDMAQLFRDVLHRVEDIVGSGENAAGALKESA